MTCQFSLRTMLLGMVLVALFLGLSDYQRVGSLCALLPPLCSILVPASLRLQAGRKRPDLFMAGSVGAAVGAAATLVILFRLNVRYGTGFLLIETIVAAVSAFTLFGAGLGVLVEVVACRWQGVAARGACETSDVAPAMRSFHEDHAGEGAKQS